MWVKRTPPYARCGRAAAGARKDPSLQRRTAARPYSRGAGSVERTPKRRWTEWDRSELAEPGPPWTPLHLSSNHRPSSECCPGWVLFFFFFKSLRCWLQLMRVCERTGVEGGGGVFSVVAAWVPWRSLSPQIWITETLRYLMCRLCKFACDAVRLHVNMLEGGTTKGPAVIWKPWLWNWSYYRSI